MDLTNYNKVKSYMKTGDLLQWRSNSLIGSLIRWKTKSDVNHSSLVIRLTEYEGEERRRFAVEALEHGVVLTYLSRRLEQFDGEVWWYPLKEEWNKKRTIIGQRALSFIGIPYDFKSIAKQIVGRVSADMRYLFCSETCYLSYGFKGIAPNPGEMPKLGIFDQTIQL